MGIKDELKQYRFKVMQVERTLDEYERFKERAEKMTAVFSDVASRTNIPADKVGDNAVFMADIAKQYEKWWQEAENERIALIEKIRGIDEPYSTILFLRYVKNFNFESIASTLGYSYKQILRLHGHSLEIMEQKKNVP